MKAKICVLSTMIFFNVIISTAQTAAPRLTPEERTKRVVDTITSVLKLDQAQQMSAQTAFMDYYKESDKLREAMQAGTPPDRSKFGKLSVDRDEKLKKVLSNDQFKKFKEEIEPAIRNRRTTAGNN